MLHATRLVLLGCLAFVSLAAPVISQTNLGTAFTYQGQMNQGGVPLNGNVDVQFTLYDVATGGTSLASASALFTPVSGGLFSAAVDFGSKYDGRALWVEMAVRYPPGAGAYTTLLPRQVMTAAPYASGVRLPLSETVAVASDNALRIHNTAFEGRGVLGLASGVGGKGVYGSSTGNGGVGVYGDSGAIGIGVEGYHAATGNDGQLGTASAGVKGTTAGGNAHGVLGINTAVYNGVGVEGVHTVTGNTGDLAHPIYGVLGVAGNTASRGVVGNHPSGNSGGLGEEFFGVHGFSPNAGHTAVIGEAGAATGESVGVRGNSASSQGFGVVGTAFHPSGFGMYAKNGNLRSEAWLGGQSAVLGRREDANGAVISSAQIAFGNAGGRFYGEMNNAGGIIAESVSGYGAVITSTSNQYDALSVTNVSGGLAARFTGNVIMFNNLQVSGSLIVGGGKLFRIDHPLDPTNKALNHSCVESPERKNIYDGTVTTDEHGRREILLPGYFEALNEDFRYQLTTVGSFSRAMVESEIKDNKFVIRTEQPHVKVCWQVTGNRHDAWAKAHPMVVEQDKSEKERGTRYFQPEGESVIGAPHPSKN